MWCFGFGRCPWWKFHHLEKQNQTKRPFPGIRQPHFTAHHVSETQHQQHSSAQKVHYTTASGMEELAVILFISVGGKNKTKKKHY